MIDILKKMNKITQVSHLLNLMIIKGVIGS